jgi:phytoene desaturase
VRRLVVIGAGQGGLSAAVHARLLGWDVTVLEASTVTGGKAASRETMGYRLDPGPSIVILPEVYKDVFRRAGKNPEDYLEFRRLDPVTRVVFHGLSTPIDLPAEAKAAVETLTQIAPDDGPALDRLLAVLDRVAPAVERAVFSRPIERWWQLADPRLAKAALAFGPWSTYKQTVDRMFVSPLLRAFFYGFPSYSGQTYDSKAAGALMIPYYMFRRGVWWPVGGVGSVPRAFERLARELGVEFVFGVRATGLAIEGRKAVAVTTTTGDVQATAVVSNVDRTTVGLWLGRGEPQSTSFSYMTFHWGVTRRLEGLGHHTLIVPEGFETGLQELYRHRRPPVGNEIVYLNDTSSVGGAPEGKTNLFAVLTVPAGAARYTGQAVEASRRSVLGHLAKHGWGFDPASCDFEQVQTPKTFAETHGNHQGSLYGPDESERLWGLLPHANRDPVLSNLFYCGGSVQPGAGLPMVTLSGMFAAKLLGPPR